MIGDRLLRVARVLYGEKVAEQVFTPLVADLQRDYASSGEPSARIRLQWLAAVAQTCIWCLPHAFSVRMPVLLAIDVFACVIAFPLIALMFQWREISMQAGHFGWRLIAALSFTVIPVVWRFRVAAISDHHARALMRSYMLLLSGVVLALGYEEWPTRVAQVAGIGWLAVAGWRLGAPTHPQFFTGFSGALVKLGMVGACLFIAALPVRLVLGLETQSLYWQQQQLLSYTMAIVTVITMKNRFNGFTAIRP
jgi:hypothetical protein